MAIARGGVPNSAGKGGRSISETIGLTRLASGYRYRPARLRIAELARYVEDRSTSRWDGNCWLAIGICAFVVESLSFLRLRLICSDKCGAATNRRRMAEMEF